MGLSSVIRAERYNENDKCAICLAPLTPLLAHRLGHIVIHDSDDGANHPMHEKCLKTALVSSNQFGIARGSCPHCRKELSWPEPYSLSGKIIGISTLITMAGAAHATFSYLTGRPLLVAIIPSVTLSLMSIDSLWVEHKEFGLRRSLGVEIGIKLARSAAMIGIPLLASITASHITESTIPNSFVTATLGVVGLLPFMTKFLKDKIG